jgi:phosphoribosylformylglycinamidine synthase
MELCPALGIAIPVGKDSLSMRTRWREDGERAVVAPVSLIVSAFAPVADVRRTLTPQLRRDAATACLLLVDLGAGRNRLGGSALAQVYGLRRRAAGPRRPARLAASSRLIQALRAAAAARLPRPLRRRPVRDARRDGFAGHCGLDIDARRARRRPARGALFAEELGAVVQVREARRRRPRAARDRRHGLAASQRIDIGRARTGRRARSRRRGRAARRGPASRLLRDAWSETSYAACRPARQPGLRREERERGSTTRTTPACTRS